LRKQQLSIVLFFTLFLSAFPALAHFGVILPSDDIVGQGENRTLELQVKFIHPAEGEYMEMARPQRFELYQGGQQQNLLPALEAKYFKKQAKAGFWGASYRVQRPGDYTFFVEPMPYWEPAEDKFILHYTKVCVSAFGLEDSWDKPLGIETEIVPLSRPYGLWTGNLFSGQVLLKGEPLPFAEIEIEYLNEAAVGGKLTFPADPFVAQKIKADSRGVFHYAMPKAGWWGFAALSDADWKLQKEGESKSVEIGAVYWVKATDL